MKKHPLFWFIISLILLTATGIVVLIFFHEKEWQEDIARQYIQRSIEKTTEAFNTLKTPIERSLLIARKWGIAGLFNLHDPASINSRFIPVLEELPHLAGMILVNTAEEEYFLMPDSGYWLVRSWKRGDANDKVSWMRLDSSLHVLKVWKEERRYLPSSRPWFAQAVRKADSARVRWYGPYLFATRQKTGITGSIAWEEKTKTRNYILAFDVLLGELIREITRAKVTPNTANFLFTRNGTALSIGDSAAKTITGGVSASVTNYAVCPNPVVRRTMESWLSDSLSVERTSAITVNGEKYWGAFRSIAPSGDTFIASVLPESDFQPEVNYRLGLTAIFTFLIITTGFLISYLLYRKFSRRAEQKEWWQIDKNKPSDSILDKIGQGESAHVEFKSTMRMNLKAGKPGKEIELAWLKTVAAFLNSDGGILFIGVDDAGEILGLEADGFENDDRCRLHFKNVFNQHIGMEFSPYVEMDLYSVNGKNIACVQCKPCSEPVFVKTKNDEEIFFIRSGPSTVKLPPSKIMKYIKQKRK